MSPGELGVRRMTVGFSKAQKWWWQQKPQCSDSALKACRCTEGCHPPRHSAAEHKHHQRQRTRRGVVAGGHGRCRQHLVAVQHGPDQALAAHAALTRLERMFRAFLRYCHNNPRMYFWDRYFYFAPEFIKERMERETRETQGEFLQVIQSAIQEGIARGEIRTQPVESATDLRRAVTALGEIGGERRVFDVAVVRAVAPIAERAITQFVAEQRDQRVQQVAGVSE